ncbi:MAG: hypothetical protein LBI56_00875 [Puniceicoccales bacterium]|jgi:hypothetical protein|nr:hypothetical protein [Puniceicoccales bacterium]
MSFLRSLFNKKPNIVSSGGTQSSSDLTCNTGSDKIGFNASEASIESQVALKDRGAADDDYLFVDANQDIVCTFVDIVNESKPEEVRCMYESICEGKDSNSAPSEGAKIDLDEINSWTVDYLQDAGVFDINSTVDIFDGEIFHDQTCTDLPRNTRNELIIDDVSYPYARKTAEGKLDTENHREILQAIKNLAAKKYTNPADQKNFILQVIQSIHKWSGQGSAIGVSVLVFHNKLDEHDAYIKNLEGRQFVTITISDSNVLFKSESHYVIKDKNSGDFFPVAAREVTHFKINFEEKGRPHLCPDGNSLEVFKAEVSDSKMEITDKTPLCSIIVGENELKNFFTAEINQKDIELQKFDAKTVSDITKAIQAIEFQDKFGKTGLVGSYPADLAGKILKFYESNKDYPKITELVQSINRLKKELAALD